MGFIPVFPGSGGFVGVDGNEDSRFSRGLGKVFRDGSARGMEDKEAEITVSAFPGRNFPGNVGFPWNSLLEHRSRAGERQQSLGKSRIRGK